MKSVAHGLYFRATCPRCVVLSWLVWLATLAAVERMPATPGDIDRLRAQANHAGKLFVNGSEGVLAGRDAFFCLLRLAWMRWLLVAMLVMVTVAVKAVMMPVWT